MKHLAPQDVVDLLDGCGQGESVRHAESCEACRTLVEDARRASGLAATDEIPEPSPLFWTQFSARVGEAVRRSPAPARWWPGSMWSWRVLPAGSLIVLVALLGLTQWQSRDRPRLLATDTAPGSAVGRPGPLPVIPTDDEPWALVSQLMADAASDESAASDMPATLGSADRAIESLTETEQAELTRLLKAEIRPSGASQ